MANLWVLGVGQLSASPAANKYVLAWLACVSSISSSGGKQVAESVFCLPTFHPLLPPRHTGGWLPGKIKPIFSDVTSQAGRAGLGAPPRH